MCVQMTRESQAADRLPEALEVAPEVVEQAVTRTLELFAEIERQAEDGRRRAAEAEEAEWRRTFEPAAVILTERTFPNSIGCRRGGGWNLGWRSLRVRNPAAGSP